MSLIDTTTLLKVADRAAYQYFQFQTACVLSKQQGNGWYFETVSETEDADVEIPLDSAYNDVDNDLLIGKVVKSGTNLGLIIGAMNAHFNRWDNAGHVLQAGGWDGYLTDKDQRVSYYFSQLFFDTQGFYMLANNVFSESEDQFARLQVTTGPSLTFTDGLNYGNGNALNPANGTFYAATQLKIVVTTMGSVDLDLVLTVKDESNNLTTLSVTVPGDSVAGAEIAVGDSSKRFLDVTAAHFATEGSTGTIGDDVKVMNLKERQIGL